MANNPYVNKVEYAGQTLMDVTDTTATEDDVAEGKAFTLASGAKGTGSLKLGNTHVWVGTCDTAALTRDKAVTITGVTEYVTGDVFVITFTSAQDYNGGPRLNVNSLGVKNIRRLTGSNAARYQWQAGETLILVYNGTYMLAVNNGLATTTYYGLTKLTSTCTSTSSGLALTASGLNAYSERMIAGVPLYDAEATYAVGDRVRNSWYIYECNTPITEPEAWNEDHWTQLPALQTQIDNAVIPQSNTIEFKNSTSDRGGRTRLTTIGSLCVLNISINASGISSAETEILTVPASLAPASLTFGVGVTGDRALTNLNVNESGSVKVIGQNNHAILNGTLIWVTGK